MKQIHSFERQQFEALFRQEQIDHLENRLDVLDVFLRNEAHVTAAELTALLEADGKSLSADFVEETLELMCRFGFAQKNRFDNGVLRYEHRHLGHHHDHMICTKCGKIIEFENHQMEALQVQIAETFGFHILQHRMELYGICGECLSTRMRQMPLVNARPGERLVITSMVGGGNARLRLMSMGLRIGDEIEVISNYAKGQLVVSAGTQRYVLGRGLAQKLIVEPVGSPPSGTPKEA